MGIRVHHVDTTNVAEILEVLNENTAMVLLETPTNPMIQIADIPAICRQVHDAAGAGAMVSASATTDTTTTATTQTTTKTTTKTKPVVVVDNTMMSPYLQRPLELGADIVYHSGTKYLSGHHDLMAGVIGARDEALAEVGRSRVRLFIHSSTHPSYPSPFPPRAYPTDSDCTSSSMPRAVACRRSIVSYCCAGSRRWPCAWRSSKRTPC